MFLPGRWTIRCTCVALVSGCPLVGCAGRPAPRAASGDRSEILRSDSPVVVFRPACVATGLERCFDARDNNCNGLVDEGCGILTGPMQVVIAWQDPNADVDLEVLDPRGELAQVERPTSTGLVRDRDCPGSDDDCGGQNFEVVAVPEGRVVPGEYRVLVRLETSPPPHRPVRVVLGGRVGARSIAAEMTLKRPLAQYTLWIHVLPTGESESGTDSVGQRPLGDPRWAN